MPTNESPQYNQQPIDPSQAPPVDTTPFIFSLAADPALGDTERNFSEYANYLTQAFDNPTIRNIAITGDFGVGKSSLIRWFEEEHAKKNPRTTEEGKKSEEGKRSNQTGEESRKQGKSGGGSRDQSKPNKIGRRQNKGACEEGFLYISMGRYRCASDPCKVTACKTNHTEWAEQARQNGQQGESGQINKIADDASRADELGKEDTADTNDVNAVERRILLQIYSRFHQKELPLTSFRMIDEKVRLRELKSVLVALFVFTVLILVFHNQLGDLAVAVGLPGVSVWKAPLHLILYLLVIAAGSTGVGMLLYSVLPRLQLSALSIKHDNVELEMERKACESYLDQYSMELVYCLEQVADKICHTVVIEDMDRLDRDTCVEVFTQMRQMNHLVNLRLGSRRYVRFVYVINNELLAYLNSSKFFDYIMPIIPALNRKTSERIFMDSLRKVDASLKDRISQQNKEELFGLVEHEGADGIVFLTAPWIRDYRMQHTILNEYSLLFSLYCANNGEACKEDAVQVLAFAIYKNIWPGDYGKIRTDESMVLPVCRIDECSDWTDYELLKVLTDPGNGFLTAHCLHYAGYSEGDIADRFRALLDDRKNGYAIKVGRIDALEPEDSLCISVLRKYAETLVLPERTKKVNGKMQAFLSAENGKERMEELQIFRATIRCMLRCGIRDNGWLLDGRDVMECLDIIGALDDETAQAFLKLCGADGRHDMYGRCQRRRALESTGIWTQRQLEVFCYGAPENVDNVTIDVLDENGARVRTRISDEVKRYWASEQTQ